MKSPEIVMHGTSSAEGAELIKNEGFNTKEGFPNVSENLLYAFKWATDKEGVKERPRKGTVEGSTEDGRIILMKVPEGIKVAYGDITEMNVDEDSKTVSGHVKNHVSGRNQLTFTHEKEEDRKSRKLLNITPENVFVSIRPSEELRTTLKSFKKDIKEMDVNPEQYALQITTIFKNDASNNKTYEELLPVVETLVKSTIESEVVNRMRLLELNVLRAKGFSTRNNDKSIDEWNYMDKAELWDELSNLIEKSDTANFGPGLESVNRYLKSGATHLIKQLEAA